MRCKHAMLTLKRAITWGSRMPISIGRQERSNLVLAVFLSIHYGKIATVESMFLQYFY